MFYMCISSVETTGNNDEENRWPARKILVDLTKSALILYRKTFWLEFFFKKIVLMEGTSTRLFAIYEPSDADNLYVLSVICILYRRNIINNDLHLLFTSYFMQRYMIYIFRVSILAIIIWNNNDFDRTPLFINVIFIDRGIVWVQEITEINLRRM